MAHDLVVGAEAPPQARIIPPALPLLDKPLGPLKFLQVTFRNNLATAATETYEQLFHRGRVLGRDYVLANEPSAARHIFGAGAASYRRPVASLRIIRPIAGAGVLTAEGAGLATAEANPRAGLHAGAPKYSRTPARQAARGRLGVAPIDRGRAERGPLRLIPKACEWDSRGVPKFGEQ